MANADSRQQEPSMEEILASIRRIISEDAEEPSEAKGRDAAEPESVLELTEMVGEGGEVVNLREQSGKAEPREPAPANAKEQGEPPAAARPKPARSRLLSAEREQAAAAAIGGLMSAVAEEAKPAGKTVEEIVRELLGPMLKTWLDENLPTLVERLVREEIERVVGRARGM